MNKINFEKGFGLDQALVALTTLPDRTKEESLANFLSGGFYAVNAKKLIEKIKDAIHERCSIIVAYVDSAALDSTRSALGEHGETVSDLNTSFQQATIEHEDGRIELITIS